METLSINSSHADKSARTSCLTTILRLCGVLALIAGVVGGAIVYFYFFALSPTPKGEFSPIGFILGLAVAFQGLLTFALCSVVAQTADGLAALRYELLSRGD